MSESLPLGFYACLVGASVGGGLALFWAYRLLRGVPLAQRLRALHSHQEGTTVVEFPFALLIFVLLVLFVWQLGFLASAYLVMDYAAFSAARSASVVVPENRQKNGEGEAANFVNTGDMTPQSSMIAYVPSLGAAAKSAKSSDIRGAAVLALYGISGFYRSDTVDVGAALQSLGIPGTGTELGTKMTQAVGSLLQGGLQKVEKFLPTDVNRLGYALGNTSVRLQPDEARNEVTVRDAVANALGPGATVDQIDKAVALLGNVAPTDWWTYGLYEAKPFSFSGGQPITVEVIHNFQAAVPFAGAVLSGWKKGQGIGYYVELSSRATILNEGYDEVEPSGAP